MKGNKITELIGHRYDVKYASFSYNDSLIVTSGFDNTVRIWTFSGKEIAKGIVYLETEFQNLTITPVSFSPDNKYIIACINDYMNRIYNVRIWDLEGNEVSVYREHTDWIEYAEFLPNNNNFITTSRDNNITISDINSKKIYSLIGHKSRVYHARVLPDKQTIISISDDGTIRKWYLKKEQNLFENEQNINFASFSHSGILVAVALLNKVKITDLFNKEKIIFSQHTQKVNTVFISQNNKYIISASNDSSAIIWDMKGKIIQKLIGHENVVNTAVFSPDLNLFLTASIT